MKAHLACSEWFPVYDLISENEPKAVTLDKVHPATFRRWKKAERDFLKAQTEIRERVEAT